MDKALYGGIELGGTKTICAIGDGHGEIHKKIIFPTADVDSTVSAIGNFFSENDSVVAVGLGSFGPVYVHENDPEYGTIYNSPKTGWSHVPIKQLLETQLHRPVIVDTDVNCAAIGELHFGAARGLDNFIYITIGTGIGGALVRGGIVDHGILNIELGHMSIRHEPFKGNFVGACEFHADCLEGLASGVAMLKRYGKSPETLDDDRVWDLEAHYLASALRNCMFMIGPEKIVIGGGIIEHDGLLETVRSYLLKDINGYLNFPDLNSYVVPSSSQYNAVLGAIYMVFSAEFKTEVNS